MASPNKKRTFMETFEDEKQQQKPPLKRQKVTYEPRPQQPPQPPNIIEDDDSDEDEDDDLKIREERDRLLGMQFDQHYTTIMQDNDYHNHNHASLPQSNNNMINDNDSSLPQSNNNDDNDSSLPIINNYQPFRAPYIQRTPIPPTTPIEMQNSPYIPSDVAMIMGQLKKQKYLKELAQKVTTIRLPCPKCHQMINAEQAKSIQDIAPKIKDLDELEVIIIKLSRFCHCCMDYKDVPIQFQDIIKKRLRDTTKPLKVDGTTHNRKRRRSFQFNEFRPTKFRKTIGGRVPINLTIPLAKDADLSEFLEFMPTEISVMIDQAVSQISMANSLRSVTQQVSNTRMCPNANCQKLRSVAYNDQMRKYVQNVPLDNAASRNVFAAKVKRVCQCVVNNDVWDTLWHPIWDTLWLRLWRQAEQCDWQMKEVMGELNGLDHKFQQLQAKRNSYDLEYISIAAIDQVLDELKMQYEEFSKLQWEHREWMKHDHKCRTARTQLTGWIWLHRDLIQ